MRHTVKTDLVATTELALHGQENPEASIGEQSRFYLNPKETHGLGTNAAEPMQVNQRHKGHCKRNDTQSRLTLEVSYVQSRAVNDTDKGAA